MNTTIKHSSSLRRWVALAAVICNVAFNYTYLVLFPSHSSVAEVSDRYYNHFTPAGYVFAIWGVIYLSFILYAVYQVWPGHNQKTFTSKNAWLFTGSNVTGAAWILTFTSRYPGISLLLILINLFLAASMFMQALRHTVSTALRFPFGIYFGWLTVASLANLNAWMVSRNIEWVNEPNVTGLFIALACFMAMWVSFRYSDLFYPAVICWAITGIYIKNKELVDKVGSFAFIAIVILAIWMIGFSIYLLSFHKNSLHKIRKLDVLND